jgi:tRNA (adenine37-N6)-methyltransferase
MNSIQISPIGHIRCDQKYRYETPRQGVLAGDSPGVIELLPNMNFEQALVQLESFERLWIIYQFHLNDNWKPMVQPPRHTKEKVGVFASRAPYRPNPIGMSCVKLVKVESLKLHISELDMLDGTPVLDIKPYLPYCDAFPDASAGWAANTGDEAEYLLTASSEAEEQMHWLSEQGDVKLQSYAEVQLQFDPKNSERKRIIHDGEDRYTLAYRTWRIQYAVDDSQQEVCIKGIRSGYTVEELGDRENDKYGDKGLHAEYMSMIAD